MSISTNSVVSIHYTLKNNKGEVIDSSQDQEPLKYLHGAGNIIPGLEQALEGMSVGEEKHVTIQPAEGYGEIIEELIQTLPREAFTGIESIEEGMEFQAQTESGGMQYVTVKSVSEKEITVDGNHALAGEVLHFDVKVGELREASEEEISHGHVH